MPVYEIPFAYGASVIGKGKRKEVPHVLMSSVLVEIASVSDREAPVALRWHRYRWGTDGHPPHDFRRFGDDGLFKSVFYSYSGRPDRYVTLEEAIENAGQGYRGEANPLFDREHGKTFHDIPAADRRRAEDLEVGSRIVSSDEAVVAANIRSLAADLVAVDGNLFFRQPGNEPIYEISDRSIWTKSLGGFGPHELDVRRHFRVDQIVEAIASADKRTGDDRPDFDFDDPATYREAVHEHVEIFDASVLAYRPDQGPALLAYAGHLVKSDKAEIGDAPVDRMLAYAALRDAVRAKDGASAEEVCSLLETYAGTTTREPQYELQAYHDTWERDRILEETQAFRMAPMVEAAPAPAIGGPRP